MNKQEELFAAIKVSDLVKVEELISEGADVNIRDEYGYAPLMRATWLGSLEIVSYLVSEGADVNIRDEYGGTSLMRASWLGYLDILKYLISKGADVNSRDNTGRTALRYTNNRRSNLHIFKYLRAEELKKELVDKGVSFEG